MLDDKSTIKCKMCTIYKNYKNPSIMYILKLQIL